MSDYTLTTETGRYTYNAESDIPAPAKFDRLYNYLADKSGNRPRFPLKGLFAATRGEDSGHE